MARMMADSMKTKDFGRDEALAGGEERTGEAAEHGADGKGRELGAGGVDAERTAGDLVLAQGLPGAADRQPRKRMRHEVGDERESEDDVVEEDDALERRDRSSPKSGGEAVLVTCVNGMPKKEGRGMSPMPFGPPVKSYQLMRMTRMISPKAKRDDGEIVAAQAQDRKAENDAPQRREQAGKRQHDPEGPQRDPVEAAAIGGVEPIDHQREVDGREQRVGIGADRVEGDVAEIEEAGETDDDVEAPAQHHIGEHQDREIDDAPIDARDEGQDDGDGEKRDAEIFAVGLERCAVGHMPGARLRRISAVRCEAGSNTTTTG